MSSNFQNRAFHLCSPWGLARAIFTLSTLYIAFASIAVWVAEGTQIRANNIYYLAVVASIAIAMATSLRWPSFQPKAVRAPASWIAAAAILALGLLAWALYRYPHLFSGSVWIDEVTQFQGDQHLPKFVADPALFAAIQQQPPIDYYLSAFARNFIGLTEMAVLFHSVLFGALSFIVFLLWLILIRFPAGLALVPIMLFAGHHSLLRFSSEARPISLAVFFSLTTLIFVFEGIRRRRVPAALVACSAVMLLNSVGLQPIFFLFVLSLSLLPILFLRFEKAEALKFLGALAGAPILIFLPTLWEIFRESRGQNQFFPGSPLEVIWRGIGKFEWLNFAPFTTTLVCVEWILFIPIALLLIALAWPSVVGRRSRAEAIAWASGCLMFSLLFPILFRISWSLIDWFLHPYYVVLWVVGLLALACQCFVHLLRPLTRACRGGYYIGVLWVVGLGGAFLLHKTYIVAHAKRVRLERSDRPDWHAVAKKARALGRPVTIIEIPYGRYGWGPYHAVAGHFYESNAGFRVVRLEEWSSRNLGVQRFNIERAAKAGEDRALWFLWAVNDPPGESLSRERENRIYDAIDGATGDSVRIADRVHLIVANSPSPPAEAVASAFAKIIEADPSGDRNFYLSDALAAESIRRGDCEMAKKWFYFMRVGAPVETVRSELRKGLMIHFRAVEDEISRMACAKNSPARPSPPPR